ncbi:MAG: DUF4012 domain-containing protein [Mycobacteriaceae bacterium]
MSEDGDPSGGERGDASPDDSSVDSEDQSSGTGRPNRRVRTVVLGALVLLLLGVAYVGYQAWHVRAELTAAQKQLGIARTAVSDGKLDLASVAVGVASKDAASARGRTSSWVWRGAAHLPLVGPTFQTVGQLSAVADDVVDQVAVPVVKAGGGINLKRLRAADGAVDLGAVVKAQPAVHAAALAMPALVRRAHDVGSAGLVSQVDAARTDLVGQVDQLAGLLDTADRTLTLVPAMLGADGPRNYFVGFQTNAESRGTGGLVGAYAIITADRGRLKITRMGNNDDLDTGAAPGIDLGADFAHRYSPYGSTRAWYNSNLTAHFPYAAQIWASLWKQQTGQQIDGAALVDPVALSYMLAASGPVTLPTGEKVSGANVVRLVESEAYSRYAEDNAARLAFQQGVAAAVSTQVLSADSGSLPALVRQLSRAVTERRLAVWSSRPAEQAVLAGTAIADEVSATSGPYAGLVVNNAAGNKMDYYLERALTYTAADCDPKRGSAVTVSLTNTGDPGASYSGYVGGIKGVLRPGVAPGTDRLLVSLYATSGAGLVSVTVDGRPATVTVDAERNHPVFTLQLDIPPGKSRKLVFTLLEPAAPGVPQVPVQPLVRPMSVTTDVPVCNQS